MNKYNVQKHQQSAPRRKKIKELRAKGWEWTEIAKRYGISPQRAQQIGTKEEYDGR